MTERKPYKTQERDTGIYDYFLYEEGNPHRGGYWVQREEDWKKELRVPLACPACGTLLMNWDTQFYNRNGVCATCNADYLEQRDDLPAFKSNVERAAYCKQKIAEKANRS